MVSFRLDKNIIHANFQHNVYKMMNFSMFSCHVSEFEGTYWVNGLHNRVVGPKDIQTFNKSRQVQPSDYVLENLKVIATREIIDDVECYTLFCLANMTYFENNTLVYCKKGESKVFMVSLQ